MYAMPRKATKTEEPEEEGREKSAAGRAIWKGSVSFGLVNVPVALFSMEKKAGISFRLLDGRDKSAIRYERVNETTGEQVPWAEIVKAFEYTKGNFVVVDEEEIVKAAPKAAHTIEIQGFVSKGEVEEAYFEKPYAVVPVKKAEKGYVLLRDTLTNANLVGIAKVVLRTKEYLAALVPKGDGLVLMLLRFAYEIKAIDAFDLPKDDPSAYNINPREMDLAKQLVDSMTMEWSPEEFKDEFRDTIMSYIEAKAEKGEMYSAEPTEEDKSRESANVIDLASLLKDSMKASATISKKQKSS